MRVPLPAIVTALIAATAPNPTAAQAEDEPSLTPLQVERLERMLERRLACRGCHVIAGSGGSIGPVLYGVRTRGTREYVLEVIRDPAGVIPGTLMPHQPIPDAEAEHLATYLMTHSAPDDPAGAGSPQAPPPLADPGSTDGAALYARHCAACHGESGAGDGWNAARLPVSPTAHADAELMGQRPDDSLFDAIYAGGYVLDRSALMPAFGDMLTVAQIRALVGHIRDLCDCSQPAWAGGARP